MKIQIKLFKIIFIIIVVLFCSFVLYKRIIKTTQQSQKETQQIETSKNQKKQLEELEKQLENQPEEKKLPPQKPELKKPILISQARLEQIKTYLFTEPNDTSKLPSDLSAREQEEINKLKNSWELSLNLLKEQKDAISKYQKICDEYQYHLNSIQPQIENLKQPQQQLEQQRDEKDQELNRLKINRKQNKAEIEKLQDEKLEIIGEIEEIEVKIGKLENKQKMYEGMLSNAIKLRDSLQRDYDKSEREYQNQIDSKLNALYQITSTEE